MYPYEKKPSTTLSPQAERVLSELLSSEYSVLVGRNNSGKSFLLRSMAEKIGAEASYIGPQRYSNFNVLSYFTPRRNKKQERFQNFINTWKKQNQNVDNSPINLQQAIAELDDKRRGSLFRIMKKLLGTDVEILQTVPDNEMSQRYLSCGGHNLSFMSSGVRLIASIVTCLLDVDYHTFMIDEPELGISPEAQGILADFLFDSDARQEYFSHIKTLIFATHSTVFLDRKMIRNNYIVTKCEDQIDLSQIMSQADFNRIHFFLLGNRFETLYLPSAIIVVEGETDEKFIRRALELSFPRSLFSVVRAGSDDRVKQVVHLAGSLLSDLQKSPYRDRIFPVLDQRHVNGLTRTLKSCGIPENNIIIWNENGIEHYYPVEAIDDIFGKGPPLSIEGDQVERNGIVRKKSDLANEVVSRMHPGVAYPDEFKKKLISPIASLCD